jgi:hypothetical protein
MAWKDYYALNYADVWKVAPHATMLIGKGKKEEGSSSVKGRNMALVPFGNHPPFNSKA